MSDGWERRPLASKTLRREFSVSYNVLGFLCRVDHGYHKSAVCQLQQLSGGDKLYSLCSSVQRALEQVGRGSSYADDGADAECRNGTDGIVHRVVADVSVLAVNDDALTVSDGASVIVKDERLLTSSPVRATICAIRTDGIAIKVISGYEPSRSLLSSRRRGFCTVVVCAVG